MTTLNINGKRVKVDESFLSLSSEQQNATVDEIAASMGDSAPISLKGSPGQATGPSGMSANLEDQSGQPIAPPQPLAYKPGIETAIGATVNGLVNSVPFLQGATDQIMARGGQLFGQDYDKTMADLKAKRDAYAQASPWARGAGEVVGSIGGVMGLGATKLGAEAMGMAGGLGKQVLNGGLSSAGLAGLNSYSQGNTGADVLKDMGVAGATGVAAPLIGAGVKKLGGAVADTVTGMAQRGMTKGAIKGAPTGQELRSLGSKMFEESRAAGVMVDRPAFGRLWQKVEAAVSKFRPNANLDPKAMGALQVLQETYDAVMKPGANILPDLQDLHILRQAAQKAALSSEGRDATISNLIIQNIDDFIRTLKPGDIAGASDPTAAANALLNGISTWHRAGKVSLIEEAVRIGEVAASGPQNGIQNAFRALIKNSDLFRQFNKAEQQAIRDVAEGTALANMMKFAGKGGIGSGGNSWLGATIAATLGASSGFGPWGAGAALAVGSAARKGSEMATRSAADTAARAAATPALPIARQAPNLLAPAQVPLEVLIKGGGLAAAN